MNHEQLVRHAGALLTGDNMSDARANPGNTMVGAVMSMTLGVNRRIAEDAVKRAIRLHDYQEQSDDRAKV